MKLANLPVSWKEFCEEENELLSGVNGFRMEVDHDGRGVTIHCDRGISARRLVNWLFGNKKQVHGCMLGINGETRGVVGTGLTITTNDNVLDKPMIISIREP